ncbi:F-box/LRR-repeat protein 16 [Hirschfeldia incana]|nr:F-box/LRR-repeat protein 16 [Hirschfeldia incana]
MGQAPSSPTDSTSRDTALWLWPPEFLDRESTDHDLTADLPDDCLAHIFQFLTAGDRKRCSLVSKRWLLIDGQNRHRLSLAAKAEIVPFLPSLFSRFDSVTKLALRCDRNSFSLSDEGFILVSLRCSNLTRVKLRGCREITDLGMEEFARNCKSLKKLSCGSCDFGARGLNAVLEHCKVLEELSVKRIRGIHETAEAVKLSSSSSLRSVCLKELVNGQVFESLIGSRTLKKLRIIRCLGNWDKVLQVNGDGDSSLTEIHLERLQVSDFGLSAISKCRKLETLHIVKTPECSDSGLVCVVERCRLLRKVHIDGWRTKRIGDEGLVALAKNCLLLQELVLIGVDATHASLSAIASNCKKLERLALCGSGAIGDVEMACIAEKCVALRKFCIKGCPVTDVGIKALALGCPNLVKLKVKKCIVVTGDVREWLRERRRTLVVSMDGDETKGPVMGSEDGGGSGLETVVEEVLTPVADGGGDGEVAGGGGRLAMLKMKLLASRNFVAFTLRRWLLSEATGST